jgi:transmembrane sensor
MKTSHTAKSLIQQAAGEWFVEFRTGEPDQATRAAFCAWLQESQAHMAAYLEFAALWNRAGGYDPQEKWPLERLIEAARHDPDNLVSLREAGSSPAAGGPAGRAASASAGRLRRSAIAASIILAIGLTAFYAFTQRDIYTTALAEQRSLTLNDGSIIQLNSSSRLRIHYTQRRRDIELIQGQALFTVAKDPRRPFIVRSNGAQVRALGTEFDIYRKPAGDTIVTVLEGSVSVLPTPPEQTRGSQPTPPATGTATALLAAGEQLTVAGTHVSQRKNANVAAITAWTQHQLVFDSTPLSDVASEFNRYNRRQLSIDDTELKDFTIDGVFSSTDPTSLINYLRSRPDVVVTETGNRIIVTRASHGG